MFDKLEARVSDLELKGFACPDLEFLRQQVDKFDPANRSLRVRGFLQKSLNDRKSCVEKLIEDLGISVLRSDHIFKGPKGQRELTDMSILEFSS